MADTKISELTSATTTNGTEVLPVVQSATTKKMAISIIKDYVISLLGTAATTSATDYAVAAKGVTNGDSHDHSGGDGAQVDHGGLAGLSDDDHSQYHNDSRGDARYVKQGKHTIWIPAAAMTLSLIHI